MALGLLDGSTSAFDFGTGATPLSWKCFSSYASYDLGRRMEDRTTFCTAGGWAAGVPTMKQASIRLDGFLGKGVANADPHYLFSSTTAVAFVMTFDTSCTLTGSMHAVGVHAGMRAQGASEFGIAAVTDGPVTSSWVVM